jgi:type IV secretion system protein VirB4
MLALQWLRYPQAKVVFFDKDRSSRAATMAVGGARYEPGNPDRPVAFQPLADIDTLAGMAWATEWIELLMALQGLDVTPRRRTELQRTLDVLADAPKHERTLSGYQNVIQDEDVREALNPYTDGAYGQIFNADEDSIAVEDWMMFEMGDLMELGEAAIVPALSYLFRVVGSTFGRRGPTLLILDEAWIFMGHPYFMSRFRAWLKTLRKLDVYVVFATQEVEDAMESEIAAAIMNACQTKLFLPNNEAQNPSTHAAYAKCGLTDAEIHRLASATPKRDYFYKSPKGRRLFSMALGPVALCFAARSGDEEMRKLDRIEQTAPASEWAHAMLKDRGLEWATGLLTQASSAVSAHAHGGNVS